MIQVAIQNQTKEEIRNVQGIILDLLENDVRCRNDDKWLTYRVLRKFTNIFIPFEDFAKIPAFETIKRCRAKIQNNYNMFPPTNPDVLAKRQIRRQVFHTEMIR